MRITPAMIKAFNENDDDTLRSLLGLKPWEVSPLVAIGKCVYPPGCGGATSWPKAAALRKELKSLAHKKDWLSAAR